MDVERLQLGLVDLEELFVFYLNPVWQWQWISAIFMKGIFSNSDGFNPLEMIIYNKSKSKDLKKIEVNMI